MHDHDLRPHDANTDEHATGPVPGRGPLTQPVQRQAAAATSAPPSLQLSPAAPGADPFDFGYATLKCDVNVRSAASTKGAIVEAAKAGTRFHVQGHKGSWLQIDHGGGPAFITALPDYVTVEPAPAKKEPKAAAPTPAPAAHEAQDDKSGGGSWLDAALGVATSFMDKVSSFFGGGDADEHRETEKPAAEAKQAATPATTPAAGTATDEKKDEPPVSKPSGGLLYKNTYEIITADAKLRDAAHKATGKVIPLGTKVFIVAADQTYVHIATSPDAAEPITADQNVWTAFSNLGGTGHDVALGNEKSDAGDKAKADELRGALPSGRQPGKSPFKWRFGGGFMPSLEGKSIDGGLMAKLHKLMEWAVENDMITGDIELGSGMRGPMTAHRMCVSWNIQYRWGKVITLDALKALPGGKDDDGNLWYKPDWSEDDIKKNAKDVRASSAIAAAGHQKGEHARAPLPINASPGVSRHCTGGAVDVAIPWRAPGKDAAEKATDLWAWEDIYKQFGLHRPLHRDIQSQPNLQEHWHIEETSKQLEGDDETDQ
jgi:hypothetical protein